MKKIVETNFLQDGIYTKQIEIPEGMTLLQHRHEYSHTSILAKGVVMLVVDDKKEVRVEAPAVLFLDAGAVHMLTAMKDSLWFCIHQTDEEDITKVCDALVK